MGEQLQTTGEHIESQHDFTQRVQCTEVGCRTDLIESRTDVIDAGNDRGEKLVTISSQCRLTMRTEVAMTIRYATRKALTERMTSCWTRCPSIYARAPDADESATSFPSLRP